MTGPSTPTGPGEFRAGGTDVMARQRIGRAPGPFVDLLDRTELAGITWRPDGSARIGALTTIHELATDPGLRAGYPALSLTAAPLATPQIRAAATLGGNLLQRNRCSYYRNPAFSCHQTGVDCCPARTGGSRHVTAIGAGPCVAPHPSSMAVPLLGYAATVEVRGRGLVPIDLLYGDGSDPARDHQLDAGELLLAVDLPTPLPRERAAHRRLTSRASGEWPLVEVVARVTTDAGAISFAAVTAGAVARTPVRLDAVDAALAGQEPTREVIRTAATRAPTPLLTAVTFDVLERALLDSHSPKI